MNAIFPKGSRLLFLTFYAIATSDCFAASWEGADIFSSGISQVLWTSRQQTRGTMTVSAANGHVSFLVPATAATEQEADLIWNGQPTAGEDFTVEITGLNAASFSTGGASQLQLVVIDARALTGGAANSFTSEFARGTFTGATQAEFQSGNFATGLETSSASALSVTHIRLRVVYKHTSQTFESWYDDSGVGTNWKLLRTANLTTVVPDGTSVTAFAVAIIANCYYGPITEGQLWVDDFRLNNSALAVPTITLQPANKSVTNGSSVSFSVQASGATNYQWRKNGVDLVGATSATLIIPSAQASDFAIYTVIASNAAGGVTSDAAYLRSLTPNVAGKVVAWGQNNTRQTSVPSTLSGVVAIAAGGDTTLGHTVALTREGTVVAWGDNTYGQATVPVGLAGVTAVAAGHSHSLAVKVDGTVVGWGNNGQGETSVPNGLSGVVAVAAGSLYSIALKSNGEVVAWGHNNYGQTKIPSGLTGVMAISAGRLHAVALKNDGTVVAWGHGGFGQTNVPGGLIGVKAISAGGDHTAALKSDGTMVAWGWNNNGQTSVPAGLNGVAAIAAGTLHTVALKGDGTAVAWGNNSYGQTVIPTNLKEITAIAAGGAYSVAITTIPTLTTVSTDRSLTLLWPETSVGYRVESASSLMPAAVWSSEFTSFQTNNGSISMVLPISGTRKFYRLAKP